MAPPSLPCSEDLHRYFRTVPSNLLERVIALKAMIDKLHRLGDVGATEESLLRKLLPLCTPEQLEHIEACTEKNGRDLSFITEKLWKNHYGRRFGEGHASVVQERLTKSSRQFTWRRIFTAKKLEQQRLKLMRLQN